MKLQSAIGCGASKRRGLMSDSFFGTNGTNWSTSNWTSSATGTGGGATIQSNAGQMSSGTAGGYGGATRTSRSANITSPADANVSGTWTPDANEPYGFVAVRAILDASGDATSGYIMYLDKSGTWLINRGVSSTYTQIGSNVSFAAAANTTYGFRLRVVGTTIQARVWSGTEPGTWGVNTTDSGVSAAGKVTLSVRAGSNAVAHSITFDDIVVSPS